MEIGDQVRLTADGPLMRVYNVGESFVDVVWIDHRSRTRKETFNKKLLTKVSV